MGIHKILCMPIIALNCRLGRLNCTFYSSSRLHATYQTNRFDDPQPNNGLVAFNTSTFFKPL